MKDSGNKAIDQIPLKIKKEIEKLNEKEKKSKQRYFKRFNPISNSQEILENRVPDKREKF